MMPISNLVADSGPSIYYDQAFRDVLEDYLSFLKNTNSTTTISVEPMVAYKFEFDFFGLLANYNIQPHLHWIIMRMNDLTSPSDAKADIDTIHIPDNGTLDHIRQSHMSTHRIA